MLEELRRTSKRDRLLRFAHRVLEMSLKWLFRPFANAATPEQYGAAGYKWFGVMLAVILAWGWSTGVLDRLLELVDLLRYIVPLDKLPDVVSQASGGTFLVLLYFTLYLPFAWARGVRVWIGRTFADLVFLVTEWLISLGEWCIRRRNISALLILGLSLAVVTLGFMHLRNVQRDAELSHRFDDWLGRAEGLVVRITFSDNPGREFDAVRTTWDPGFARLSLRRKILESREARARTDPATALRGVFSIVEAKDTTWSAYLHARAEALDSIAARVEWSPATPQSPQGERVRSILALMLAKAQVQLVTPDCRDQGTLVSAMSYLDRVFDRSLAVHRENGRGVIYACVLSVLLNDSTVRRNPGPTPICASIQACAGAAFRVYQRGGQLSRPRGSTACSYEQMRSQNNTVDLLVRLGSSYGDHRGRGFRPPLAQVVRTPAELKAQLRTRTESLLTCARSTGPPLPTLLVTAGQAYGTIAGLSTADSPEFDAALRSAAAYLQFAYLLQPDAVDNWDLGPLCPATTANGDVRPAFVAGLNHNLHAGAPQNVDILVQRLEDSCRPNA